MLKAQTRVPTDRASRYLVQLCEHLQELGGGGHHPQPGRHPGGPLEIRHVEWTDARGSVVLGEGQFTLDATPDALSILVEAPTAAALERLKTMLTSRLDTFGRRDHLTVAW